MKHVSLVGGKNASLGELYQHLAPKGISIPFGFAITSEAYRLYLEENKIVPSLRESIALLDSHQLSNLSKVGTACRQLIASGTIPFSVADEIKQAYTLLVEKTGISSVAVRSSATAEDLPTASFAGQHDSFLNIEGIESLLEAVKKCYISLFNDRAIKYRHDNHFDHMQVALSVGVQQMVRADLGSAGVAFTIDPETGFRQVVYITAAFGLGEAVVQGAVSPDEFYVFKPSLELGKRSVIYKQHGAKEHKIVYAISGEKGVIKMPTTSSERSMWSICDEDAETLGRWCCQIERHYGMPMDIEWAKDGQSGKLFIVQARPETVHASGPQPVLKEYRLHSRSKVLCKGRAVGRAIISGRVCIVQSLLDADKVQAGDVIVADMTNPDWNALLRKAVCIVTNKGGRTSHASIVARELGIHAVVGTGNATEVLHDGQLVTVSCAEGEEGIVYEGKLDWSVREITIDSLPPMRTRPMFILADPHQAFRLAAYPNEGVGLLRMEFIISKIIRIHPMALVRFDDLPDLNDKKAIAAITWQYSDKKKYFIETLSQAIALIAAAFYPKDVIVRMSDFKTNEYAQLIGGRAFEPEEENPMLGFRGASRYYHDRYREGFLLECAAIKIVRDEMGLTNLKVMIPFCRTPQEGRQVIDIMKQCGLERGKNNLQLYVMIELPANVIQADELAQIFDGFSIGSNDLTQLTLGIDRDSSLMAELFDENNEAVKTMITSVIQTAKKHGIPVGLCGQAPSDMPEFARFLVNQGIDSISFTPDAILTGIENILNAECDTLPPVVIHNR